MQLREYVEKQRKLTKPGKYRAQKVELDGYTFDSKAEARYYEERKLLSERRRIRNLVVHPGWDLGSCYYKSDFAFEEYHPELGDWVYKVIDIKGVLTRDCAIKIKLMHEKYNIDVLVLTEKTDPRLFR